MKNIFVVCPEYIDIRELELLRSKLLYNVTYSRYNSDKFYSLLRSGAQRCDLFPIIDDIVTHARAEHTDGVISSHDCPGSIITGIVAQRLGIPGLDPAKAVLCQHKYHARLEQQRHAPHAVPHFTLLDKTKLGDMILPVVIKPVKGRFSIGASCVYSVDQLNAAAYEAQLPSLFLDVFDQLRCAYTNLETDAYQVLAEQLIQGHQVTFEGYVYQGRVEMIGVVDSIMYPGTICFRSFEYPTILSVDVQKRMHEIARTVLQGIGLDNTLFNIEFIYDDLHDQIYIIEINTRMSCQFADLFEKVNGANSYALAMDLAVGKEPIVHPESGTHRVAGICVLRIFKDQKVIAVPSEKLVEQFMNQFPDARVQFFVSPGQKISEATQDGKSYRYALFSVGARDHHELHEKFEYGKKLLSFTFESL